MDAEGNVFLAGEATGEVRFGESTVQSSGGGDFFLAKLDAEGRFHWAHMGGGSLVDRGYGVTTDRDGNAYVTGHYQSTDASFSGTPVINRGDSFGGSSKYSDATLTSVGGNDLYGAKLKAR